MIIITPTEDIENQIKQLPEMLASRNNVNLTAVTKCLPLLEGTIEFNSIYILKLLVFNHQESVAIAAVEELIEQKEYDFLNIALKSYSPPINGNILNKLIRILSERMSDNKSCIQILQDLIEGNQELSRVQALQIKALITKQPIEVLVESLPQWNQFLCWLETKAEYTAKQYFNLLVSRFAKLKRHIKYCHLDNWSYIPKFSLGDLYHYIQSPEWFRYIFEHCSKHPKLVQAIKPLDRVSNLWDYSYNFRTLKNFLETYPNANKTFLAADIWQNLDWQQLYSSISDASNYNAREIRSALFSIKQYFPDIPELQSHAL